MLLAVAVETLNFWDFSYFVYSVVFPHNTTVDFITQKKGKKRKFRFRLSVAELSLAWHKDRKMVKLSQSKNN